MDISLRPINKDDAERMFEILDNDQARMFFGFRPADVKHTKRWIGTNLIKNKKDMAWSYVILDNEDIVGYVEVELGFKDVGWVSYCIDEPHWGKGIASTSVGLIEQEVKDTKLTKLGISLSKDNVGSEKVALKCGYVRKNIGDKLIKTYTFFKEL